MVKSLLRTVDDFLDDELYNTCVLYSIETLNSGELNLKTNHSWDYGVVKDSPIVLIHKLTPENELYMRINESIQNNIGIYNVKLIQFYYWLPGSHIPWHDDTNHNGAITIYLNKNWSEDWGGIFLFKDENNINGIYPKSNMALHLTSGIQHAVCPTTKSSDIRFTIQVFY